ncbi:MAG: hypothetical protein WAV09_01800 [Minisyncoccia bacterium]
MRTFLISLSVFSFMLPISASAIVGTPFGGRIVVTIPCTCQVTGMAVYVIMPKAPYVGMLLWQYPITRPYASYWPYPRAGILGRYQTGGQCMVGVQPYCYTLPVIGTITIVGTGNAY